MYKDFLFEEALSEVESEAKRMLPTIQLFKELYKIRVDRIPEDFPEFFNEDRKFRKYGSRYGMLCPDHNERTPSFFIYTRKNAYRCFGCGLGGGPISLTSIAHQPIDEISGIIPYQAKTQNVDLILDYLSNKSGVRINFKEAPENLLKRLVSIESSCIGFNDFVSK